MPQGTSNNFHALLCPKSCSVVPKVWEWSHFANFWHILPCLWLRPKNCTWPCSPFLARLQVANTHCHTSSSTTHQTLSLFCVMGSARKSLWLLTEKFAASVWPQSRLNVVQLQVIPRASKPGTYAPTSPHKFLQDFLPLLARNQAASAWSVPRGTASPWQCVHVFSRFCWENPSSSARFLLRDHASHLCCSSVQKRIATQKASNRSFSSPTRAAPEIPIGKWTRSGCTPTISSKPTCSWRNKGNLRDWKD